MATHLDLTGPGMETLLRPESATVSLDQPRHRLGPHIVTGADELGPGVAESDDEEVGHRPGAGTGAVPPSAEQGLLLVG